MTTWYERFPGLLDDEISALEACASRVRVDSERKALGKIEVALSYCYNGRSLSIRVVYPDLYPFFRPAFYSDDLSLDRHQGPGGGDLCLIARGTRNWDVDRTAADVLSERLPILLAYDETGDLEALAEQEDPQGEPASVFFNQSSPRSLVVFDGEWGVPSGADSGTLTIEHCGQFFDKETLEHTLRGYVSKIADNDRNVVVEAENALLVGTTKRMVIPWVRLQGATTGDVRALVDSIGPEEVLRRMLENAHPGPPPLSALSKKVGYLGVLFKEEVQQGKFQDGWVILAGPGIKPAKNTSHPIKPLKVERYGLVDLAARSPAASVLGGKKVLQVGASAIGSFLSIELARSGLSDLVIVDHDDIQPSTIRRYALGESEVGTKKIDALARRIGMEYPQCSVSKVPWKIGDPNTDAQVLSLSGDQHDWLLSLASECDLILDTSAEHGVGHYLSTIARELKLPHIEAYGTPGVWGGSVGTYLPKKRCWLCVQHAMYGTGDIDEPPMDPLGMIQPAGCAERTFSGTSFDLQTIGSEAMRAICSTLASGDQYPKQNWVLATLALREPPDGQRVPPTWSIFGEAEIAPCPICSAR